MKKEIENLLPEKYIDDYRLADAGGEVEEIRLRVNSPIMFYGKTGEFRTGNKNSISKEDLEEALEYIFGYSVYAYENEIREGFVTVKGGHRVGIAGKVITEDNTIKGITNISSVNIRVSHEINGVGNKISKTIFKNGISNVLIISPPMAGKTTLLRDLVRIGSDEYGFKISVIDERGEIGAAYMGVPSNNIGIRSDIFDNTPKDKGIMMAVRAMSPQIVAVDEIGQAKDVKAIEEAFNCGVKVFATIHGRGIEDIKRKEELKRIINEKYFEYFVVVKKCDRGERIMQLYDENGCELKE